MKIHTGEKPFECTYPGCFKLFKAYPHLSDHLKRHYNIKPFSCQECSASFARKNTLKTHLLIHSGIKPFKCTFSGCAKSFVEKGNMKTHYKTHLKCFPQRYQITHSEVIIPKNESVSSSDGSTDVYLFGKFNL
jgi:uncharacterized Zn-finger protein